MTTAHTYTHTYVCMYVNVYAYVIFATVIFNHNHTWILHHRNVMMNSRPLVGRRKTITLTTKTISFHIWNLVVITALVNDTFVSLNKSKSTVNDGCWKIKNLTNPMDLVSKLIIVFNDVEWMKYYDWYLTDANKICVYLYHNYPQYLTWTYKLIYFTYKLLYGTSTSLL